MFKSGNIPSKLLRTSLRRTISKPTRNHCTIAMAKLISGDTFFLDNFVLRQWDDPKYAGVSVPLRYVRVSFPSDVSVLLYVILQRVLLLPLQHVGCMFSLLFPHRPFSFLSYCIDAVSMSVSVFHLLSPSPSGSISEKVM